MYENASQSGTPSTAATQQNNLSLPGSSEVDRPSTRRGGRPGSQSGGSADQQLDREKQANRNGTGDNTSSGSSVASSSRAVAGPPVVDVWTREQGSSPRPHNSQSSAGGRRNSESAASGASSAANGGKTRSGHRPSYPELSEPDHYSSEQFEEDSEGEEEEEKGEEQEREGEGDDFNRKLRELASRKTRSLHETLQSAIRRGPSSNAGAQLPEAIGRGKADHSGTGSSSSRKSSKSSFSKDGEQNGHGKGKGASVERVNKKNGTDRGPELPIGSSAADNKIVQNKGGKAKGNGKANDRGTAGKVPSIGNGKAHLANGTVMTGLGLSSGQIAMTKNNINGQQQQETKTKEWNGPAGGGGGGKAGPRGSRQRPAAEEGSPRSDQIDSPEGKDEEQEKKRKRPASSIGGRGSQEQVDHKQQQTAQWRTPLGFGSSSARNCLATRSANSGSRGRKMNDNGEQPRMRQRSASVTGTRAEDSSGTYRAWVRQKVVQLRERKSREEETKRQQEENKAKKRELAEKNFVRWKSDLDRRMAEQKERQKKQAEEKAKREKEKKEEKRTNAERTFQHWRKTEEERTKRQRERARSAGERKREAEERRKEQKRREADEAFHAWLKEADKRKREKEEREREKKEMAEEERREQAEMKSKIAEEAFGLWLRMKDEECKYRQSLAFRILDFERKANSRWPPSGPWLPTSPTVRSRLLRPPPGLVQGRRRTLEKRVELPHSKPSSDSNSRSQSAKSTQRRSGTTAEGEKKRPYWR